MKHLKHISHAESWEDSRDAVYPQSSAQQGDNLESQPSLFFPLCDLRILRFPGVLPEAGCQTRVPAGLSSFRSSLPLLPAQQTRLLLTPRLQTSHFLFSKLQETDSISHPVPWGSVLHLHFVSCFSLNWAQGWGAFVSSHEDLMLASCVRKLTHSLNRLVAQAIKMAWGAGGAEWDGPGRLPSAAYPLLTLLETMCHHRG